VSGHWSLLPASTPRSAFGKIALNETRLAWRQPIGLVFGVGMPLLLLVIFGSLPAFHKHQNALGGLTYFNVYIPVLLALVIAMLALLSLPTPLASYREQGILRRLSTTPAPPAWVLAAQLVINLCLAAMAMLILVALGIAGFGEDAAKSPGGLVLAIAASVAALFSIGLWIAAIARTAAAAGGLGSVMLFPMLFFAGLWVPRADMPKVLLDISNYTPLGAAVQAAQAALQSGFPPTAPLLILLAYADLFATLAVRFFRWE